MSAALHAMKVIAGLDEAETQTTPAERELLVTHLPGAGLIVEIGVFEGRTTQDLLRHADEGAVVYGVDPFFRGRLGVCWSLVISKHGNRDAIGQGRLKLVRAFSTEVGTSVPAEVDFVFLDGDHSLEGITADWKFWADRVPVGGKIALHDVVVPKHNPRVAGFGSHQYFESHISKDARFTRAGSVDSVVVLERVA